MRLSTTKAISQEKPMTSNKFKSKNMSVCEKTHEILIEVIRLSSLTLAQLSLRLINGSPTSGNYGPPSTLIMEDESQLLSLVVESQQLKEPEHGPMPNFYMKEPLDQKDSQHKIVDVDRRATVFITDVRKKFQI
ncbi:hypothetical protein AAC387_Pa09g0781 [Persea americana]